MSKINQSPIEPLVTIKRAAAMLGIEYRQLLRGVDNNEIPFYRVGNSRRLVCLSEILTSIRSQNHQNQGDQHV